MSKYNTLSAKIGRYKGEDKRYVCIVIDDEPEWMLTPEQAHKLADNIKKAAAEISQKEAS